VYRLLPIAYDQIQIVKLGTLDSSTTTAKPRARGARLLRAIGVFKLAKGTTLIAAAISVFRLIHKDLAEEIIRWAERLHIAPGNIYVERLVDRALRVTQGQLIVLGIILLAYSVMFTIEGVGLLLLKRWAEWMTVITTSALIPLEIFEVIRRPSWVKVIGTLVNIVIAVYLVFHVRNEMREKHRLEDQPH
jgi:uncharacterized membrane protein (DUF2068 family)